MSRRSCPPMPRNLLLAAFRRNAAMPRGRVTFVLKGGRGTVSLQLTLEEAGQLLESGDHPEQVKLSFSLVPGTLADLRGQLAQFERRGAVVP